MAARTRTRRVDVSNPSLAIDCPRCGLRTARFLPYCLNCSNALWPDRETAARAFALWKAADSARAAVRPFDLEPVGETGPRLVDYEAKAHELGIHIFPSSNYPFLICLGFLFLGFTLVPFAGPVRLVAAVVGGIVFLWGIGGWLLVEDVRMYEDTERSSGEGEH